MDWYMLNTSVDVRVKDTHLNLHAWIATRLRAELNDSGRVFSCHWEGTWVLNENRVMRASTAMQSRTYTRTKEPEIGYGYLLAVGGTESLYDLVLIYLKCIFALAGVRACACMYLYFSFQETHFRREIRPFSLLPLFACIVLYTI